MRKRSSCDGFQQSAVSVPVFTGSFDSVFSGSEEMAQSGAVAVQPCILCMGGAGLYYTDVSSQSWSLIPAGFSWTAFLRQGRSRSARVALIGSSVVSLSLLGFFKYADFVIGTVNSLTGSELGLLKLALPDRHFILYVSDDVLHD